MTEERPKVPADLKRAVLLEAGHRCAIPTCRHPTTEVAHIIPYFKIKKHEFHNLIALCPNCHTRFEKGEIDCESMKAYKQNLPVVSSRYNDMERRVLAELGAALRKGIPDPVVLVPGCSRLTYAMAIKDGLLEYMPASSVQTGTPLLGSNGKQTTYTMEIEGSLLEYMNASSTSDSEGISFWGSHGKQTIVMVETIGACKLTQAGKQFADRWLYGKAI